MQIVFLSKQSPEDYTKNNNNGKYPDAPNRCPFRGCKVKLPMKKNGFYERFLVTDVFHGRIRVRRYCCPKCGRTVSMLPSFCAAGFTYGAEIIISLARAAVVGGSVRKAVREDQCQVECLSRQLVAQHLRRLRDNRRLIQYGLNQISPENANIGSSPGDTEWTKRLLLGIKPTLTPEFNAEFHKATGRSFMSMQNRIA
jgi:hypothetical protein